MESINELANEGKKLTKQSTQTILNLIFKKSKQNLLHNLKFNSKIKRFTQKP